MPKNSKTAIRSTVYDMFHVYKYTLSEQKYCCDDRQVIIPQLYHLAVSDPVTVASLHKRGPDDYSYDQDMVL